LQHRIENIQNEEQWRSSGIVDSISYLIAKDFNQNKQEVSHLLGGGSRQ
jgi:hypothetical protein